MYIACEYLSRSAQTKWEIPIMNIQIGHNWIIKIRKIYISGKWGRSHKYIDLILSLVS